MGFFKVFIFLSSLNLSHNFLPSFIQCMTFSLAFSWSKILYASQGYLILIRLSYKIDINNKTCK